VPTRDPVLPAACGDTPQDREEEKVFPLKFVHTADTHLGYEITKSAQPHARGRKKRGDAVLQNFCRVVEHALQSEVDLFIHSGDLFNKYYIPLEVLDTLIQPMMRLSDAGIPVLVIPGNHERSQFPFDLFHGTKDINVFDHPKSMSLVIDGYTVGIAGFPFIREGSGQLFFQALEETEYQGLRTDLNILVTHQAFDGAVVGPVAFRFREGRRDTVTRAQVPTDFAYVAAGHIHRYQILPHPLKPGLGFVYPGSTQRMSFAEMHEDKGFIEGELLHGRIETRFIPLPAWEMEMVEVKAAGLSSRECEEEIKAQFWRFTEDLVIRFNLTGGTRLRDYPDVDFAKIRDQMPPVLECQFAVKTGSRWTHR